MKICHTCGVEHDTAAETCRICADERQWVPAAGQQWTTLEALAASGHQVRVAEVEPDLFGISVDPFAIGQRSHLLRTPDGNLLWDVVGYCDAEAVRRVRELGPVVAIAASHPHHYGVQVEWSRALGGVPVLVAEADQRWVARADPVIRPWAGELEVVPGVTLVQVGGHFPGSAVGHWPAGAGGKGVLLSADTIQANPDRATVTFMRSYPKPDPALGRGRGAHHRERRGAGLRPRLRQLRQCDRRRRSGRDPDGRRSVCGLGAERVRPPDVRLPALP